MVTDIVQHLTNDNKELKKLCASAIFKVSEVLLGHSVTLLASVRFDVLLVSMKITVHLYAIPFDLVDYY
jgi:hypothetical protein